MATWPRPALDCGNNTCTIERDRCRDEVYLHVGGIMPDCDRHHLFEMLAFLHDVLRAAGTVYWVSFGLGAY